MKILFFVLVVLMIIGLINLRFRIKYCKKEGFNVILRVVFFRFFLYSSSRKKKKDSLQKKDLKKEKSKKLKKKKEKKKKKKQKKSLEEILEIVKILLKPIPKFLKFLNRGFRITNVVFRVEIASSDAKNTALIYANFSKFFYISLGIICSYCKVIKKEINIKLNFLEEKPDASFNIDFRISIGRIFIGILLYLFFVVIGFINKSLFKK